MDVLTFAIWMAFVAFLLACDLSSRSGTFAGLLVLAALPWTGLAHTLYWAGDELYYAVVLSPVMVALLRRRLPFAAGLLAGFMLFSRLSYGFACFGVVLWLMLARRESLRDLATFVLGAIVYCGVVWGLFWLVGGADFLEANFVRYAMVNGVEDTQNPLMRAYIDWRNAGADRRLTDVAVIMALMTAVASLPQMRRAAHPFWHLALGGLMAHTLAISPVYKLDYVLTITIPAFYALALGGRGGESPSRR